MSTTKVTDAMRDVTEVDATKISGAVPSASLTNVDLSKLEYNQAILAFKIASANQLAKFSMVDQVIDEYQDATGIDAGNSTNELAGGATTAKYYEGGTTVTPSVSGNYDSTATDGDYTYYKWTTVRSDGTYTTDTSQTYDFLVVAGGGSGGASSPSHGGNGGGGGGAGGLRNSFGSEASGGGGSSETALTFTGTISSITVGAGGATTGATGHGNNGANSVFSTITSTGGGAGGMAANENIGGTPTVGSVGGSGGGGGAGETGTYAGGAGTSNQGFGGGTSATTDQAGGGGGAASVGLASTGGQVGGFGGTGVASSITGASVQYAGGGGGGGYTTGGTGVFGGGNGGNYNSPPTAGTTNTGGGGGGRNRNGGGMAGGSGIVIIRRETSTTSSGGNLTLQSVATTAESAPTTADLVMLIEDNEGTATINTDIKAKVSRDGSAFSDYVTLEDEGDWGTDKRILVARNIDISGIASGTAMKYKIETLNQSAGVKETRIHATSLAWA